MRESRAVVICMAVIAAWLLLWAPQAGARVTAGLAAGIIAGENASESAGESAGGDGATSAFFETGLDFESNTLSPLDLGRELGLGRGGETASPYKAVIGLLLAGRTALPGPDEPDPYAAYRSWEGAEGRAQGIIAGFARETDVRGVASRDTLRFARALGGTEPLSLGVSVLNRSYEKAFVGATLTRGRFDMDYVVGLISGVSYLRLDAAGVGTKELVVANYDATYWPPPGSTPGPTSVKPRSFGATVDLDLRYKLRSDLRASLALRNVLSAVAWQGAQRTQGLINTDTIGTTPDGYMENLPLATGTNSQATVVDRLDPSAALALEWRDPTRSWAASAVFDLGVGRAPSALARVELAVGRDGAVGVSAGLRLPGWPSVSFDVSRRFRDGVFSAIVGIGGTHFAGIGQATRSLTVGLQFAVGGR